MADTTCWELKEIRGVGNELKRRFNENPARDYRDMNFWFFLDIIGQTDRFEELHLGDCPICAMEKSNGIEF